MVYGVRPKRTFLQAATKYLNECTKATVRDDASRLAWMVKRIGSLPLESVHMGTLMPVIEEKRREGVWTRTLNHHLRWCAMCSTLLLRSGSTSMG